VSERPIAMSGESVRAILAGQKTQTRRVMDLSSLRVRLPETVHSDLQDILPKDLHRTAPPGVYPARSNPHGAIAVVLPNGLPLGVKPGEFSWVPRYGEVGDRLWVKEAWRPIDLCEGKWDVDVVYAADGGHRRIADRPSMVGWKAPKAAERGNVPSLYMPRWASRLTLEIVNIRAQRVQTIAVEDAMAEGTPLARIQDARAPTRGPIVDGFANAWDALNGKRGFTWDANPWVWAITFRVVEREETTPAPRPAVPSPWVIPASAEAADG